jgi:hypothetical protein
MRNAYNSRILKWILKKYGVELYGSSGGQASANLGVPLN